LQEDQQTLKFQNNMKKFQSMNEWLNEQEEVEPTYGCVMLDAKMANWEEDHTDGIDPNDVYVKPYDDSYGIEDNPHVTVLYGIHEDEIDPEVVLGVIEDDMDQVTVTITDITIFSNDEYDVVKYDVPVTKQLQKYRDLLMSKFENTQTFPDYHPHMTLAYVKPGAGEKYISKLDEPFEVTFTKGVYSFHNEEGETTRKENVFDKPVEEEIDKRQALKP
jgi:2'-5' RNA ligase